MNTNAQQSKVTYGITKSTLSFYTAMVAGGFNFDIAMGHLAKLYANNKLVATGSTK